MKRNKEILLKRFGEYGDGEVIRRLNQLKGEYVYLSIDDEKTYKTHKQNKTFHSLLQCYYGSGCSSFDNFDQARGYFKNYAGLIDKAIMKDGTIIIKEKSWSDVTKENAKLTIDRLLHDMDEANVLGSGMGWKYKEILEGMGVEV